MDVHKSAVPGDMLQDGAQWFAVNYQYASQMMLKVFKEYKYDFYRVDKMLFSPAYVIVTSTRTGKTFRNGKINLRKTN